MIYNEEIAERVRMGREELGLSQHDLAERAGVSRATVARIEGGGADSVSFGAVIRVLNAANWSIYIERGVPAAAVPTGFNLDSYLDSLYGDAR